MKNEILNVLLSRRSIRKYKSDPLSQEDLDAILETAIYAPSAMNKQSWHFSVVRSKAMLAKVQGIMKKNMLDSGIQMMVERASEPGFVAFFNAPALVILSAPADARSAQIDCGIAVENIALAAESLGIGSCIMTSSEILFFADQDGSLGRELGFPEGNKHVCSISLGYKDENPPAKERKTGLVNYV
jgi:nitroreductase